MNSGNVTRVFPFGERRSFRKMLQQNAVSSALTSVMLLILSMSVSLVAEQQPNILVLFADDLGFSDLSCYGHPTIRTPNIDHLAKEGMRFTQWYSGFHVCSPSRASMMTGRLPIRVGIAGASWTGGVFNSAAVGGLVSTQMRRSMLQLSRPLERATHAT